MKTVFQALTQVGQFRRQQGSQPVIFYAALAGSTVDVIAVVLGLEARPNIRSGNRVLGYSYNRDPVTGTFNSVVYWEDLHKLVGLLI